MSRFTNPVPQFFLDDGSVASFGRMYFYENNNFAVLKDTFSLPDNTVPNTNPLKLTGAGRLPSCHGEGLYSVKFYSANPENPDEDGTLIWSRNDVSLSELAGQFELWSPAETYTINDIAKDPSDGFYYQLYGAPTSKGEQPSTSLTKWEVVYFLTGFNPNKIYGEDDIVVDGGFIYRSLQDDNEDTPPSAKWANLTFNDSIAGNFSVGGNLTAAGTAFIGGNVLANSGKIIIGSGVNTYLNNLGQISYDDATYYDIATPESVTADLLGNDSYDRLSISTLGGTFTSGQIDLIKLGNVVTITVKTILAHASSSSASSDIGGIPAKYRPTENTELTIINGVGFDKVTVQTVGNIQISHLDSSFASVNRTSCPVFTISYVV